MAWLSLDRAIRIAATRGDRRHHRLQHWIRARDAVATDVRTRGFDPSQNTYTAAYDSVELDASVLVLPMLGLEPATSPRVTGTVDAIRRQLGAGGPLLYRYPPGSDGLDGGEGAFLPCSFWLVQALARTGRPDEAEALLDELLALGGPLGRHRRAPRQLPPSSHPRRPRPSRARPRRDQNAGRSAVRPSC
jgi:GH15 family glucan-1,4-alpha-glucosidase